MREEFFIERQGRRMVLYAGLLSEAHERGLAGIFTDLIQAPSAENGEVAIAKAKVSMFDEDGDPRIFEGIGDASPENVGNNIKPHLIRMAETRAKARALRDAINVGVTAYEEAGGEEEAPRPAGEGSPATGPVGRPTPKQIAYLKQLIEAKGSLDTFTEKYGRPEDLTRAEASGWIERLKD